MRTAKTLIRLGGCPGWSESSLGAEVILLFSSCGGSVDLNIWSGTWFLACRICSKDFCLHFVIWIEDNQEGKQAFTILPSTAILTLWFVGLRNELGTKLQAAVNKTIIWCVCRPLNILYCATSYYKCATFEWMLKSVCVKWYMYTTCESNETICLFKQHGNFADLRESFSVITQCDRFNDIISKTWVIKSSYHKNTKVTMTSDHGNHSTRTSNSTATVTRWLSADYGCLVTG